MTTPDSTRGHPGWRIAIAVGAGLGLWLAVWVFSEMVDDVPKGEFEQWDGPTLQFVRGGPEAWQNSAAVAQVARGITNLGSASVLALISLGTLGWLAVQRRWGALIIVAAGIVTAQGFTTLLKLHFERVRPTLVEQLVQESTWSFPSGHALMSAMIYLTVGVLVARAVVPRRGQFAIVATAFMVSFLIGLSRIYLGVHYPTDVIAGWSAGTAWAILCSVAVIWTERR